MDETCEVTPEVEKELAALMLLPIIIVGAAVLLETLDPIAWNLLEDGAVALIVGVAADIVGNCCIFCPIMLICGMVAPVL